MDDHKIVLLGSADQLNINELKTDDYTKETHRLLQLQSNFKKHLLSKSTSSLGRCTSLKRLNTLPSTTTCDNLGPSTSSASSKLRRLNIFCTIRHRRIPRAIRNISTTFRKQLNVLRPTSADADELAARECLLDLDDFLESLSRSCLLADQDEEDANDDEEQRKHEEAGSTPPRSMGRRNSFREAMENAVPTSSLDTDYSRIIPNTNELIIHAGTSGSISRASSDTDVSRNSYSNYEATAPHASLFIDESSASSASEDSSISPGQRCSDGSAAINVLTGAQGVEDSLNNLRQLLRNNPVAARINLQSSTSNSDEAQNPAAVYTAQPSRNATPKQEWPLQDSRVAAATCCTLGLFNVSRFAILSIHYGGNFLLQFMLLSLLFGAPMLWLQMCLGSHIKRGPVSMWQISPICKGIGIAMLLVQTLVAIYSTISVSWVLVYFRDSVAKGSDSRYRWEHTLISPSEVSRLAEATADYFNYIVLQRWGMADSVNIAARLGVIRFQLAFNVAVIWAVVFCVSCEYIKANGRAVMILVTMQILGLTALCFKVLSVLVNYSSSIKDLFPTIDWSDFMLDTNCWFSAAQEVFLTWALLGSSVIAIFSKAKYKQATHLRRDALLVTVLTLFGLSLAAVLGNGCVKVLNLSGYLYMPGSFESRDSNRYLYAIDQPLPQQLVVTPHRWIVRYSSVSGEGYRRLGGDPDDSGYQGIRLATELFPATLAAATTQTISSFWSVLGFVVFIMFGITQLFAMWIPITQILGNSISAILLSCVTGVILAIPLATQSGIHIMYFLDFVLGGSWCVVLLCITQLLAIFLFRGRPYTGDVLVKDLKLPATIGDVVALSWNIMLPIGMMTLCIVQYKRSQSREMFHWMGESYWPAWSRKLGGLMQMVVLLIVPATSIVQTFRYLSRGPTDILDRFELLMRPSPFANPHEVLRPDRTETTRPERTASAIISLGTPRSDAPPKYTPPPSYTTATGARIVKMLRNTIRRSVRRLRGERPDFDKDIVVNNIQVSTIQLTEMEAGTSSTSFPPQHQSIDTIINGEPTGHSGQPDETACNSAFPPQNLDVFARSKSLPFAQLKRRHNQTTSASGFDETFAIDSHAIVKRSISCEHLNNLNVTQSDQDEILRVSSSTEDDVMHESALI